MDSPHAPPCSPTMYGMRRQRSPIDHMCWEGREAGAVSAYQIEGKRYDIEDEVETLTRVLERDDKRQLAEWATDANCKLANIVGMTAEDHPAPEQASQPTARPTYMDLPLLTSEDYANLPQLKKRRPKPRDVNFESLQATLRKLPKLQQELAKKEADFLTAQAQLCKLDVAAIIRKSRRAYSTNAIFKAYHHAYRWSDPTAHQIEIALRRNSQDAAASALFMRKAIPTNIRAALARDVNGKVEDDTDREVDQEPAHDHPPPVPHIAAPEPTTASSGGVERWVHDANNTGDVCWVKQSVPLPTHTREVTAEQPQSETTALPTTDLGNNTDEPPASTIEERDGDMAVARPVSTKDERAKQRVMTIRTVLRQHIASSASSIGSGGRDAPTSPQRASPKKTTLPAKIRINLNPTRVPAPPDQPSSGQVPQSGAPSLSTHSEDALCQGGTDGSVRPYADMLAMGQLGDSSSTPAPQVRDPPVIHLLDSSGSNESEGTQAVIGETILTPASSLSETPETPLSSPRKRATSSKSPHKTNTQKYVPYEPRERKEVADTPVDSELPSFALLPIHTAAPKPPAKQTTLTQFCATIDMAQVDIQRSVDQLLQIPQPPNCSLFLLIKMVPAGEATPILTHLPQWLHVLEEMKVEIPGDGHCYYIALFAVTTGHRIGNVVRQTDFVVGETKHNREGVNGTLQGSIQQWLDCGAIHLDHAFQDLVGPRPPDDDRLAILMIKSAIARARAADPKQYADKSLWAGPLQLMATAAWLRQPVYVMDVGTDDLTHTQRYSLALSRHGTEYVRHDILTPEEAYVNFATHLSCQVLPLIILLEHLPGTTTANTIGHYSALRYRQEAYESWHGTDGNSAADGTPAASFDAESSYVPSQDQSDVTVQQRPATRATAISHADYDILLQALDPAHPLDYVSSPVWWTAQAANKGDFCRWRHDKTFPTDLQQQLYDNGVNLRAASQLLMGHPNQWLDLMQNLSYPEVMLAQLQSSDLSYLGKRILCEAHDVVVHVAIGDTDHARALSFVTTWISAVHEVRDGAQWKLAYGADRWKRLQAMVPLTIVHPNLRFVDPSSSQIPETEWCALLTVLLCLARALPVEWVGDSNATLCARLLQWFQTPGNQGHLRDALATLRYSNWNGLRELIALPICMVNLTDHVEQAKARFAARRHHASAGRC